MNNLNLNKLNLKYNLFFNKKLLCLNFKLLETTLAIAGEIALIKVNDVIEAFNNDGFIKMTILKRKNKNIFRYVQIDLSDLNLIKNYINLYRKKIIKKTFVYLKSMDFFY